MTIKEIVQRIQDSQQMAGSDPARALKLNRELFVDLARQDEVYIVPEAEVSQEAFDQKLFRPYIGPAQENDPRLFLRIFSHRETAESFVERLGKNQICKLDGVELIQLAKTNFLRGIYGFLLNDGQAWAAISFPGFLTDCFRDILGDPTLARPEYVTIIQFLNMVRQNRYYHIQAGHQKIVDASKPIEARFLDKPDNIWSPGPSEWEYADCTIQDLVQAAGLPENATIYIRASKTELEISPAKLRAALCATGLAERGTQFDLDFHTEAIALDYRLEDFDMERLPFQAELAELPQVAPEPEPEEVKPKEKRPGLFAKLFAKRKKPAPEPEEEVLDLPEGELEPEPPVEKGEKAKKAVGKLLTPKFMIRAFFLLAFLIIAIAILGQVFKPVPKDEFEKALETGNYTEAAELYDKCVVTHPEDKEELLQMVASLLDTQLAAYADDQITANQLAETIAGCEKIPAMASKCDAVYVQAAALENSKLTYQSGLLETSMSKRLSIWRGVTAEDTGSQRSMRTSLDENAGLYKSFIFTEASQMEVGEALKVLNLLQSYYPDDNEISKEIKDWLDKVSQPSADPLPGEPGYVPGEETAPVTVQDVYVTTEEEGCFDLRIEWANTSGKTIEKVTFNVIALDAYGNVVSSNLEDGTSYTEFIAISQGPYEDGFRMPEPFFWPNAWVNPSAEIKAFEVTGVQAWYSDKDGDSWSDYTTQHFGDEPLEEPQEEEEKNSGLLAGIGAPLLS